MDSSSPLDLDSTSKLLSRLDLIEKNTRLKNMDDMDTDLLFEVRDTSDRMAMIPPIHGSSGPSMGREDVVEEIDMPSSGQRMGSARKTYAHCRKDSGLYRKGNSTTARNGNEQLCRQASLTRLISRTLDAKPSSQAQGAVLELEQNKVFNEGKKSMKTIESSQKSPFPIAYHQTQRRGLRRKKGKEQLPVFDGGDVGLKSRDKGKGIVLSSDTLQIDASRRHMGQGRLVRNGYIFPCNIAKSHTSSEVNGQNTTNSVDGETCSSLVEISNQDNMKGIDLHRVSQPETGQGLLRQSQSDTIPRNSGPRKMVHNGCISPHNMAQGKNAAEDVGKTVFSGLSYGFSSHQIHAVSPDSEGIHADKKKGKVILDDNTVSNTQNIQATPHSARVCSITGKEVTVIADDDSALRSSKDIGWRTAHDLAKKAPVYSLHRSASVSKREDTSSYLSDRSHEIVTGNRDNVNLVHDSPDMTVSCHKLNPSAPRASSESEPQSTRRQRRQKFMKGKRKCNSDSSSNDGYSSSALEGSGTSCLQSSRQFPNTKLTRTCDSQHQGTTLGPVIEVDELQSTEVRCRYPQEQSGRVPDDTSARARQLESDEILARQLQEQFFHELPGFGGAEERDTSIAHLYGHYPQLPFQNSSGRSANRDRAPTSSRRRRNFYSHEMDLETTMMAEVRRNFSSAEMDLEMRHNFLEALEAAFDNSNDMFAENVLQINRNFNENDYEILLSLDDNNHQRVGASESQINSLPQSVIQIDNIEEACAVCLESPSIGDIIRHLPCLHKFHKECIDTWLRRRTSCPVCKSDII